MLEDFSRPAPNRARDVAQRLVRAAVRKLQTLPPGLLEAEGAKNLWDEICVQARRDSVFWELYGDEVERRLAPLVAGLKTADRLALWLETYAGECLAEDEEPVELATVVNAIKDADIVRVLRSRMTDEAMNYSNAWIRDATGE